MARNVLGGDLQCCCNDPITGFFRNGKCDTDQRDAGMHTVCVEVTDEFLQFALDRGNDLITPAPHYNFPGLVEGNRWCVCVGTVVEAIREGIRPRLVLNATHASVLEFIDKETMQSLGVAP